MRAVHREGFRNLSATFTDEQRAIWDQTLLAWKADPTKHSNPYDDVKFGESESPHTPTSVLILGPTRSFDNSGCSFGVERGGRKGSRARSDCGP